MHAGRCQQADLFAQSLCSGVLLLQQGLVLFNHLILAVAPPAEQPTNVGQSES